MPTTPTQRQEARDLTAWLAAPTKRGDRLVHQALQFLFAAIMAVLGALLLLHYLTPCEAGQLCAGAAFLGGSSPRERADEETYAQTCERLGYIAGWRWGLVCGACAGGFGCTVILLGALALGMSAGNAP